jgi:allantoicase
MDDGWETRRRRDTGHDWIRYRLVARSEIRAIEIDTAYLKGNAAGWASVSVRDTESGDWAEVLPRTRLQPDTNHRFVLSVPAIGTHARVDIFPDGGISRLRLLGSLTEEGAAGLRARHREVGG